MTNAKKYPGMNDVRVDLALVKAISPEKKAQAEFIAQDLTPYIVAMLDFAEKNGVPLEGFVLFHAVMLPPGAEPGLGYIRDES